VGNLRFQSYIADGNTAHKGLRKYSLIGTEVPHSASNG